MQCELANRRQLILTIMAVVAVLEIHMERNIVQSMKPNMSRL